MRDANFYNPRFSPWLHSGYGEFAKCWAIAKKKTLVGSDRCYGLMRMTQQALRIEGEIWECGVYKGGTAGMMAQIMRDAGSKKSLRLFDTFEGMPETDPEKDMHRKGDFKDTSLEAVKAFVGTDEFISYHQGFMPDTFMDRKIALAHVDVDIYRSVKDCCEYIYPRLSAGGFLIFDDYGEPSCQGARDAVDEFFKDRIEVPMLSPAGHAIVFKIP